MIVGKAKDKGMKRESMLAAFVFAGLSMFAGAQDNDPVLMTINGKNITKSEFEYIYHKNNRQQVDTNSIDEYLPLFINYKLKVDAAEKACIDTTAAFRTELNGYRDELAKPYLIDREMEEKLLQEAYDRLKVNVEMSHILFSTMNLPDAAAREEVRRKATEVLQQAREGADFAALAEQYSDDPSAKGRGGYLGYIKGGRLIYPFEKVAFSMKPGEVSDLVETRFGYHIIKVHNVRPDMGERLCAHIFIQVPQNATPEEVERKKALADEIYKELQEGADFATLAREKSDDKSNASRGGELPWCGVGDFVKEFENAAFALKEKGDIAAPVRSMYGFHIIKLLDSRSLLPFNEMRSQLEQRIARDERGSMARESMIAKLKQQYNYRCDSAQLDKVAALSLTGKADSLFVATLAQNNSVLATYGDKQITASEVAASLGNSRILATQEADKVVANALDRLATQGVIDLEKANLDKKYPEFYNLINEYRDGMLLFEISNKEVWGKASADTEGLTRFFKKNKKKYAWDEPHFKGYIVSCSNDTVAREVKKRMKKFSFDASVADIENEFNTDSLIQVSIRKGIYVKGDDALVDELVFKGEPAQRDEKLPVVFVTGKKLKKPEAYTDVRGQVTADYQEYLEEQWLARLNDEATVVINEDVLKTIK